MKRQQQQQQQQQQLHQQSIILRNYYNLIAQSTDMNITTITTADNNNDFSNNFPQGCTFSPDGLCILTSTAEDSKLRLYNTPPITTITKIPNDNNHVNDDDDDGKLKDNNNNCLNDDIIDSDKGNNYKSSSWTSALSISAGDSIRSYAWYPRMSSSDSSSCCFIAVSRDQPVHLYDAYTGAIRASYCPYNAMDELESPTVVTITPNGQHVVACGFKSDRTIYCFDIARPGRDVKTIYKLGKTRKSSDGQKGLVSSIDFQSCNTSSNRIFAVATYSPASIYIYDDRVNSNNQHEVGTVLNGVCVVGHGKKYLRKRRRLPSETLDAGENNDTIGTTKNNYMNDDDSDDNWFSLAKSKWFHNKAAGGITQLLFSPNSEYFLYSASRRSNTILAWDLRMLSGNPEFQSNPIHGINSFETINNTNQRIEFDFDRETGKTLFVGGQDNCVRIYDASTGTLQGKIEGFFDTVNGVSHFRGFGETTTSGKSILAVATGSRHFPSEAELDVDSDTSIVSAHRPQASLSLFMLDDR